jgi:transcription elongation factor GreB
MSTADKNYITPSGLERLRSEYSHLFHVERPKIVETVAWAASNGDRSENADYIYGKRRLREIDSRLRFLAGRMEKAEVVDPSQLKGDKVLFGATVTVLDEEEKLHTYQIVGEDEWNIQKQKISWKSPVAKALMGKKVNDQVIVHKPHGEEVLEIQKIEFRAIQD